MGSYRLAPAFRWQNAVEGDNMRIRLRPVGQMRQRLTRPQAHLHERYPWRWLYLGDIVRPMETLND